MSLAIKIYVLLLTCWTQICEEYEKRKSQIKNEIDYENVLLNSVDSVKVFTAGNNSVA